MSKAARFMHLMGLGAGAGAGADDGEDAERVPSVEEREEAVKAREDDVRRREEDIAQRETDVAAREAAVPGDDDEDEEPDGDPDDETVKKAKAAGHGRAIQAAIRRGRHEANARARAIFESPHAGGRVALACALAFDSTMTAAAAIRALQATPKAGPLGARMDGLTGVRVPPAAPDPGKGQAAAASWDRAMAPFAPPPARG